MVACSKLPTGSTASREPGTAASAEVALVMMSMRLACPLLAEARYGAASTSVVVSAGGDADLVFADLVDEAVLIKDPA